VGKTTIITPGTPLKDVNGQTINCQLPHITKFGDTWYMYGQNIKMEDRVTDFPCYSSPDLGTWTFRGTVLKHDYLKQICGDGYYCLPHVFYNTKNNNYVLIMSTYLKVVRTFTSPTPTGPFTYRNAMNMANFEEGVADWTIFQDTDGKLYFVYNEQEWGSDGDRSANIYQLNDSYSDILPTMVGTTTGITIEGLWMFHRGPSYFLIGSSLTGYGANDNFYLTSKSIAGPWKNRGLIAPSGTKTYNSQTFHGFEVTGSKGSVYVYVGERWNQFSNGVSIFLPVIFDSDTTLHLKWYDKWTIDTDGSWSIPGNPGNRRQP
jgi:hypothetical protein